MKIIVIGTSNSVIGNKGYIKSLRVKHEVTQFSVGRTPSYYFIQTLINHKELIESHDLLIIDHYVNDVNFYHKKKINGYIDSYKFLYEYLSSLNVNILNILFPISDLAERSGIIYYELAKSLSIKYNISILDLNLYSFNRNHFYDNDKIHLKPSVSYVLGLLLNSELNKFEGSISTGGVCYENPYRVVDFKSYSSEVSDIGEFSNKLVDVNYLSLNESIVINNNEDSLLLSIGYLNPKGMNSLSGVSINDSLFSFSGVGYYVEAIDDVFSGDIVIAPITGWASIPSLMNREVLNGDFKYCYVTELLFIDTSKNMKCTSSSRKVIELDVGGIFEVLDNFNNSLDFNIKPKSVDLLRDMAIEHESRCDFYTARDFMFLASQARPSGGFIKNKLKEYERILNE